MQGSFLILHTGLDELLTLDTDLSQLLISAWIEREDG